jgi:hypothetical protein
MEPINHFFIIVDFGLGIKGRNLFHLLQVELLTGFRALVELSLRRSRSLSVPVL